MNPTTPRARVHIRWFSGAPRPGDRRHLSRCVRTASAPQLSGPRAVQFLMELGAACASVGRYLRRARRGRGRSGLSDRSPNRDVARCLGAAERRAVRTRGRVETQAGGLGDRKLCERCRSSSIAQEELRPSPPPSSCKRLADQRGCFGDARRLEGAGVGAARTAHDARSEELGFPERDASRTERAAPGRRPKRESHRSSALRASPTIERRPRRHARTKRVPNRPTRNPLAHPLSENGCLVVWHPRLGCWRVVHRYRLADQPTGRAASDSRSANHQVFDCCRLIRCIRAS